MTDAGRDVDNTRCPIQPKLLPKVAGRQVDHSRGGQGEEGEIDHDFIVDRKRFVAIIARSDADTKLMIADEVDPKNHFVHGAWKSNGQRKADKPRIERSADVAIRQRPKEDDIEVLAKGDQVVRRHVMEEKCRQPLADQGVKHDRKQRRAQFACKADLSPEQSIVHRTVARLIRGHAKEFAVVPVEN